MENFGPIILIEVVLVFGSVLLFAWWQLRDLKKVCCYLQEFLLM